MITVLVYPLKGIFCERICVSKGNIILMRSVAPCYSRRFRALSPYTKLYYNYLLTFTVHRKISKTN
ncbi:hypothetical protein ALC56_05963 [Trachymyrmex septentrionalis]|uniref:Uncharacterized protein n=1 Tax=Trachymyrmex septentrionalis TaxID=34720 RepID=A0A195FFJ4_9HYME|nr:hypothetical protein ALC56_05963 [Trachymyrmex septentrionalis]